MTALYEKREAGDGCSVWRRLMPTSPNTRDTVGFAVG
jgi:hypothetical protein